MFATLFEILSEKHYCVQPGVFQSLRTQILHNIEAHVPSGYSKETRLQAVAMVNGEELAGCPQSVGDFRTQEEVSKDETIQTYLIDPSRSDGHVRQDDDTKLVDIIRLTGPMTRNGDDCSYGSKDHRDLMMSYANNPRTAAHIIYAQTPGGMASVLRDYRKAINYCHAKGQKVYLFCDGDVASAGAFLGCMCDEIWANNPDDEIGSLGMYCAFFTMADGAENKITSEVYRELYADASTDKNGWYRKAAEGDMAELAADLNADLTQVLANAKKDRPALKKEQLTGKMYRMGDVKGSLVDHFGSLAELCKYAVNDFEKRKGAALPAKEPAVVSASNNQSNTTKMKTYSNFPALIGEAAYESQTDGTVCLTEDQADRLEARAGEVAMMLEGFSAVKTQLETAKQALDTVKKELEAVKNDFVEAQQKSEENDFEAVQKNLDEALAALEAVTAERDAALQECSDKGAQLEAKEQELGEAKAALEAKETELATAGQTISDLNEKIGFMKQAPGEQANGGESPRSNGAGVTVPQMKVNAYKYDPALSVAENMRLKNQHDQELKSMAFKSRR